MHRPLLHVLRHLLLVSLAVATAVLFAAPALVLVSALLNA